MNRAAQELLIIQPERLVTRLEISSFKLDLTYYQTSSTLILQLVCLTSRAQAFSSARMGSQATIYFLSLYIYIFIFVIYIYLSIYKYMYTYFPLKIFFKLVSRQSRMVAKCQRGMRKASRHVKVGKAFVEEGILCGSGFVDVGQTQMKGKEKLLVPHLKI